MTAPDAQTQREQLEAAARLVIREQFGATSFVQRKLRVGYATAVGLMDELERYQVVGPADGTRARKVLVATDQLDEVVAQIRGVQ